MILMCVIFQEKIVFSFSILSLVSFREKINQKIEKNLVKLLPYNLLTCNIFVFENVLQG